MCQSKMIIDKKNRELIIRQLKAGDEVHFVKFFELLGDENYTLFHPHLKTSADYLERITEHIAKKELTYLAFYMDIPVAYFFLREIDEPMPELGIGIISDFQGVGIGGKLIDILITDAKKLGFDKIRLTTRMENENAFNLYQRKGFKYIGNLDKFDYKGDPVTEREMILSL